MRQEEDVLSLLRSNCSSRRFSLNPESTLECTSVYLPELGGFLCPSACALAPIQPNPRCASQPLHSTYRQPVRLSRSECVLRHSNGLTVAFSTILPLPTLCYSRLVLP